MAPEKDKLETEFASEFIIKKEKIIQKNIDYLKNLIEDYSRGVEECIAPKISGNATHIERTKQLLEKDKKYFMDYQKKEVDDLEGKYIILFQKLVNGYCECKPSRSRAKK